jgi:DNA invertase Pin-like site-specific DNA recombinase
MTSTATRAAIWARVSTADQDTGNQLAELRDWAKAKGLDVVAEYVTEDSAWSKGNGNGGKGAVFDARRAELLEDARLGKFDVCLVWGIDRLSRRGAEDMLATVRKLTEEAGVQLWSLKDPWVQSTSDPFARELMLGIFGTIARFESERRSARVKAGLARRKAAGQPIGRRAGSRDVGKRNRSGYVASWEAGGSRRLAQGARAKPANPD